MPYITLAYAIVCQFFVSVMISYAIMFSSGVAMVAAIVACAVSLSALYVSMNHMSRGIAYCLWSLGVTLLSVTVGLWLIKSTLVLAAGIGLTLVLGGLVYARLMILDRKNAVKRMPLSCALEAE